MNTLYDFGTAVAKIRDAVDVMDVRGARNAELVSMIYRECTEIIHELNRIVEESSEESKK